MQRSWKGQICDRELKLTLVDPEIQQDFEKAIFKFIEQIINPSRDQRTGGSRTKWYGL